MTKIQPGSLEAPSGEQHGGETALFRAVIAQALDDATTRSKPNAMFHRTDQAKARAWLTTKFDPPEVSDFEFVCHAAGLDPVAVRDRALALKANDWKPWIRRGSGESG